MVIRFLHKAGVGEDRQGQAAHHQDRRAVLRDRDRDPEVANINPLTDQSFYVLGNTGTAIALFDQNKQLAEPSISR